MLKRRGTILFFALLTVVLVVFMLVIRLFPTAYSESIRKNAGQNGLEPELVASMIKAESNYDEKAVSSKGAKGLMQLLPSTAEWVAKKCGEEYAEERLFESDYNLKLGTFYFAYLLEQTDSELWALAAYNAGLSNVRAWQDAGITDLEDIPYPETRNYIKKIQKIKKIYKILYAFKEI